MSYHEQFAPSYLKIGLEMAARKFDLWKGWFRFPSSVILLDIVYRVAFILSFSTLMTTAIHHPQALRGLSRWTLTFVTNGPNTGFWKRKRRDGTESPTPCVPTAHDTHDLAPIHNITNNTTK